MKKPLILLSAVFSLVLLVFTLVNSENLNVSCEAGGPYIKNSTINIFGNVTNVTGVGSNVTININSSTSIVATKSAESNSEGKYQASINSTMDVGNYTVNVTAERLGVYGNCTDDVAIGFPGASGVCVNRTISINGTGIYRDTGKAVASGTAYLSIVGQTPKSSSSINPDGTFSISVHPCLILGNRYYLMLATEDGTGRRSWSQILYVTT